MKRNNTIILIFGCIAFIGAFMPIATKGDLFVNISHLRGLTIILYLLPIIIITVSIIALYQKISNPKPWYITIGIIGFVLSILTVIAA